MQKLFDRMGTEQHKYRLALHFTSLYVGYQAYLPPGVHHRIVLQRGSKKYTSNYLPVKAGVDNPINESIQVKATMFYDQSRQQYQEKKFDIVIYRKDVYAETPVAKFAFMAENHLGFRGEQVVYQDSLNRLHANIYCERIDGGAVSDNRSTSSVSGRSSIDRSSDMRRRSQPRESMPPINHMLMPGAGYPPSPSSQVSYQRDPYHQYMSPSSYQVIPGNEQIRKSIVEQVRFDYDKQPGMREQLRTSQQRTNQHLGPSAVHYNHPQQGGYSAQTEFGFKLPPPPQSPPKMQSQLLAPSELNRQAALLLQATASPQNASNSRVQLQKLSDNAPLPQESNPFLYLTAKLAEEVASKPTVPSLSPQTVSTPYSLQPPLDALRENFRIQVSNPEQTEQQLKIKALNTVDQQPHLEIGLVTSAPMQPPASLKTSKPKTEEPKKPQSPSLTFKDLINVENERLPVVKRSTSKKDSLDLTKNPSEASVMKSKSKDMTVVDAPVPSSSFAIVSGPDITAVDSQFVEPPAPAMVCAEPLTEPQTSLTPTSIQQAKESCMTASFKVPANFDDRLLNASFESPKFIEEPEYGKRQQIAKQQLERERESYRQDLCMRRKLQEEKDAAYDNEIRLLNQQLTANAEKYQQEIAMRQQFIGEKEEALEVLKRKLEEATTGQTELRERVENLERENASLKSTNQQQREVVEQLTADLKNTETNLDVQSSQNGILKSQFDQLFAEHQRSLAKQEQIKHEYSRLKESHADLNEHKASVDQISGDIKARLDQALIELESTQQAKLSLEGDNGRLSNDLRTMRQHSEELAALNTQLQSQVQQLRVEAQEANRLGTEYERLSLFNRNSIGEMEELRAQNELLAKKQGDLLEKYINNFNDLNVQRSERERAEERLKHLPAEVRKRQEIIGELHRQIKNMEFTMVNPEEDPNYLGMKKHNQELQAQVQQLQQQMQEQSQHLQAELATKQNHIDLLNDKLGKTQAILTETMTIFAVKEQTLNDALAAKDRRLAEIEKQSDRLSTRSEITVKYTHADQDRRQLLLKIETLQSEVERLRDLEDEFAVAEAINKDLEIRVKQLSNENVTLKQDRTDRRSIAHVQELQAELARTNTKLAEMLQLVFRRNPSLAHQLAKLKV